MAQARPSLDITWRSHVRRWRWRRVWLTLSQRPSDRVADTVQGPEAATSDNALIANFERFIRQYERPILNYLWRMTGDEESAYDLSQEVFLRAWQHFDTVRHYDQPRGWLFRVATNLALTYTRRRSLPPGSPASLTEDSGPGASDPAHQLVESDHVRRTLLRLNPRRRAALVLREVYGLSCAEVGQALGMSEASVRMALHRSREQFRDLYGREEERV